jgi:DNA polymerase-4
MGTVVHVDMDAFYCAVETLFHPEYAGRPLIVGGHRHSTRAVVASCSYEARTYGVRSAMPIAQAARLCPDAVFIPPRMHLYQQVSAQLHALLQEMCPVVEPLSIDEAFLDMTGCEHFFRDLEAMGRHIQNRVLEVTGCPASVGIAPNKLLAKLASDYRKPRGLMVITSADVPGFLLPLPVRRLWGVGEKTAAYLHSFGIETVADLQRMSEDWLVRHLGKPGVVLYQLARGIDTRPVRPPGPAKSIGREITFPSDVRDKATLVGHLRLLAADVSRRLAAEGRYGRTVTLKVRYSDFSTVTRQQNAGPGLQSASHIAGVAEYLLRQLAPRRPIRLLGIAVSQLCDFRQLSLFADPREPEVDNLLRALNSHPGLPPVTRAAALTLPKPPQL